MLYLEQNVIYKDLFVILIAHSVILNQLNENNLLYLYTYKYRKIVFSSHPKAFRI